MNLGIRSVGPLLTVGLLCVGVVVHAARSETTENAAAIRAIIAQLGDEQYTVRDRAEQQLLELGTAAFDQLLKAVDHADLEISSRASYILPRLQISWVGEDDSEAARQLMQSYGKVSQADRELRIQKLAELEDHSGLGPLCRIARYEATSTIARMAALAILESEKIPVDRLDWGAEIVAEETLGSSRVPVQWIRLYLDRLREPAAVGNDWLERIDQEIGLYQENVSKTDVDVVFRLLKFYLAECQISEGRESSFEPLKRMIDLTVAAGGNLHNALVFAFSWSTGNQQWETIVRLENEYAEFLQKDRLLLYMVAEAADRRGDGERAKEIAERAHRLDGGKVEARYSVAGMLADIGSHDWAELEWQAVIENMPANSSTSYDARRDIATMCYYDRDEFQKASDTLKESLDAIEKKMLDELEKKKLEKEEDDRNRKAIRRGFEKHRSQQYYFSACQAGEQGDFKKQRELLEKAYKGNVEDPDVLIALHRLQGADEAFKKTVRTRILKLSKKLEADIKANPRVPGFYNHWAWLVSNTEGDFKKAVEYSHKSLSVMPENPSRRGTLGVCYAEMRSEELLRDSPSYLDTLGRCYYAAGDLENAIKYQQQAIDQHPHLRVMRRQLALFESELAAQDTK